jgi:hypothetical protein
MLNPLMRSMPRKKDLPSMLLKNGGVALKAAKALNFWRKLRRVDMASLV